MSYYLKKIEAIRECLEKNIYSPTYDKKKWKFISFANCYAYSLDIPVSDPKKLIWIPGSISIENKSKKHIYSSSELLEGLYSDLEFLNMLYREGNQDLEDGEYKISVYGYREHYDWPLSFHFVRQDADGLWSEKPGWSTKLRHMNRSQEIMERYKAITIKNLILKKK